MKFLVASHTHSLIPLAWRLHKEDHDIELVVMRDRFEKAWEGLLPKALRGKAKGDKYWEPFVEQAQAGELTVVTDSTRAASNFSDGTPLFGPLEGSYTEIPHFMVGGWFTGAEFRLPHLVVADWGLWPGGLGPLVPGGATLVRKASPSTEALLVDHTEPLRERNYRGLVAVGVQITENGLKTVGLAGGWQALHYHLFLSDLEGMGDLLLGVGAGLKSKYVVGLPVTVPPFPLVCNVSSARTPIQLSPEDHARMFFHDIQVNEGQLYVGGLDGFIGVARGSASRFELARSRAVQLAARVGVPAKQFRPDTGQQVETVLGLLEELGLN